MEARHHQREVFLSLEKSSQEQVLQSNMVFSEAMSYLISLRVRVSSKEPLSHSHYCIQLRGGQRYKNDKWFYKNVLHCPPQTRNDGWWVICRDPYIDILEDIYSIVIKSVELSLMYTWMTK